MDDLLHVGVDISEPYLRYWGRRLRRWKWRPILADLILGRSLRRDLPAIPAPSLRLDKRR